MRLNADGSADNSFGFHVNYNNQIRAILVQSDGRILVAGSFSMILDRQQGGIVRLDVDGTRSTARSCSKAGLRPRSALWPSSRTEKF